MPNFSKRFQNVLIGAGTVLELVPVRRMRSDRRLAELRKKFSGANDSAEIYTDWMTVGDDLRAAVDAFAKKVRAGR